MWWGYSPALDLLQELEKLKNRNPVPEKSDNLVEINILLVGAGDGRHILKTLAQTYRHDINYQINFYVYEASLDLVARQVLFFTIALEPQEELGLQEKTRLFLELYGNTLVRPTTANYITRKSAQFVHMVTDLDFQVKRIPLLQLDQLKYKERDYLENVFKFWQLPKIQFPITKFWDNRLRKHLGTRYDSRSGVFDWDYHMRLRPHGGDHITSHEYKNWRRSGVAFTWLESEITEPNLTLATGAIQVGDKLCHHGYLGDIVTGPFAAYSVDCEDKEMLRIMNGTQAKRTADIAERNVSRIMYELLHHEPFVTSRTDDTHTGVIITELTDTNVDMEDTENASGSGDFSQKRAGSSKDGSACKKETYSAIPAESSNVIFLPISAITDYPKKDKYKNFFDIVTVSENLFKHVTKDLVGMIREEGLLIVETKLYLLHARKDDLNDFAKTLDTTANECNICPEGKFDPLKDSLAFFTVKKTSDDDRT